MKVPHKEDKLTKENIAKMFKQNFKGLLNV